MELPKNDLKARKVKSSFLLMRINALPMGVEALQLYEL